MISVNAILYSKMSTFTLRRHVKEKEKLIKRWNGQQTTQNTRINASVIVVNFFAVDYATHGRRSVRATKAASTHIELVASWRDYCARVCVCVLSFDTNASCRHTPSHLKHAIYSTQFTSSTPSRTRYTVHHKFN